MGSRWWDRARRRFLYVMRRSGVATGRFRTAFKLRPRTQAAQKHEESGTRRCPRRPSILDSSYRFPAELNAPTRSAVYGSSDPRARPAMVATTQPAGNGDLARDDRDPRRAARRLRRVALGN